jgi:four helix bundle protein
MKPNVLLEKTFEFAVKSVKLAQELQNNKKEYVISRQLAKAATSIGANAEEAIAAQSTADFISKLTIAQKEARETKYWLRLIQASEMHDCTEHLTSLEEILRILASIILTTKQRGEKTAKPIHNS